MKILPLAILVFGFAVKNLSAQSGSETVVNPPALELGTLLISGDLGVGQSKQLDYIAKCELDSEFQLKAFSCERYSGGYEINKPITLPVGYYVVTYSGSIKYGVEVKSKQLTKIILSKISVPAQEGTYFQVFQDLTDPSEQVKMGLRWWGDPKSRKYKEHFCKESAMSAICVAFNDRPAALKSTIWNADSDGNILQLDLDNDGSTKWRDGGHMWVNDPSKAGGFVSVFPGVYIVRFDDPFGRSSTRKGVVVN